MWRPLTVRTGRKKHECEQLPVPQDEAELYEELFGEEADVRREISRRMRGAHHIEARPDTAGYWRVTGEWRIGRRVVKRDELFVEATMAEIAAAAPQMPRSKHGIPVKFFG